MAAKAAPEEQVRIIAPDERRIIIAIEGTAPLLTNRMNDAAVQKLTDTKPTKRGGPKVFDEPEQVWKSHLHVIDAELQRFGIPGAAIHRALISAGRFVEGVFMSELRGMFRVDFGLQEILGSAPEMHFALGRPQKTGPIMPIYRPKFERWEINVPISYDARLITLESLVNLFERAGYSIGIGAFRPECSGGFGTFKVKRKK